MKLGTPEIVLIFSKNEPLGITEILSNYLKKKKNKGNPKIYQKLPKKKKHQGAPRFLQNLAKKLHWSRRRLFGFFQK